MLPFWILAIVKSIFGRFTGLIKPILQVLFVILLVFAAIEFGVMSYIPLTAASPVGLASADSGQMASYTDEPLAMNTNTYPQQSQPTNDTIETSIWDDSIHQHNSQVTLYGVEFEDGQAIVHLKYSGTGTGPQVQVTDSTRQYTGQVPKTVTNLHQGRNIIRVELTNPEERAVTVDVKGGSMFLYHTPPEYNWTPSVPYVPIVVGLTFLTVVGMITGVELFNRRENKTIEQEL